MDVLGIDIGGTGIKGAPVDIRTGSLTMNRYRVLTPNPATPDAVAAAVADVAAHFGWNGVVGCCFPAVIQHGVVMTAANVSDAWIGCDAADLFQATLGRKVTVLNDADAAGYAEMKFGAGKDMGGTVLLVTLGTGIGSAVFVDGRLVPNTEFGHIEIDGRVAEKWTSGMVLEQKKLSWRKWASRLNVYLQRMEAYLWPDLIIVGGGVSRKHEKFFPHLSLRARIVPAELRNEAGIVGAALAASVEQKGRSRGVK